MCVYTRKFSAFGFARVCVKCAYLRIAYLYSGFRQFCQNERRWVLDGNVDDSVVISYQFFSFLYFNFIVAFLDIFNEILSNCGFSVLGTNYSNNV